MATPEVESHTLASVRRLVLVRHASTAWSRSGRHTGRTDIPLDDEGRVAAAALTSDLKAFGPSAVYSSPLRRALETCALGGLTENVQIDPNLLEWDYGQYEGLTTAEIEQTRPGWRLFSDGCPGGESASDVGRRVDAFLRRIAEAADDSVIVFAHGHVLRVLAARWLALPPARGASFRLDAASISTLGWEHDTPTIATWNH
jgi:broad specificity phosphatase PhoE